MMTTSIWWLRRDFRLRDNPALHAARESSDRVYAVYCLDDLPRDNPRQRAFALGCLRKLRIEIEKHDGTLTVASGAPENAIVDACKRLGADAVHCAAAYDGGERAAEAAVETALGSIGARFVRNAADVIHSPEAVAAAKQAPGEGYRVFPPFYDAWAKLEADALLPDSAPNARDAQAGALPDAPELTDPAPGESAATDALKRFVTARAASYSFMGAFPATDGTSKLAAYLRFGCLSPREVYHAIQERMARTWTLEQERQSMRLFLRRLAQRDFFIQLAYFAPQIHDEPLQQKMQGFEWSSDSERLAAWAAGRTGYPIVDAALRQLRDKGHVHQRAAVCAASFCCFDLGLDWRLGRDVWMQNLIAADAALCDGNWQWIAGIGSDQAAYPRIYNPVKQARSIDAQGVYVRRWVRELSKLPTRVTLTPWELSRQQQTELGFFTPGQYPPRIVDHEAAARGMLQRYQDYRNR